MCFGSAHSHLTVISCVYRSSCSSVGLSGFVSDLYSIVSLWFLSINHPCNLCYFASFSSSCSAWVFPDSFPRPAFSVFSCSADRGLCPSLVPVRLSLSLSLSLPAVLSWRIGHPTPPVLSSETEMSRWTKNNHIKARLHAVTSTSRTEPGQSGSGQETTVL